MPAYILECHITCWRISTSHMVTSQSLFSPREARFRFGASPSEAKPFTRLHWPRHLGWCWYPNQLSLPSRFSLVGTGDLQVCCHVYSPFFISVVCGLCYKGQDYEFLSIFIYCHFLGLKNSAEKSLILLFLTTHVSLQSPVAMDSCVRHARGYGTWGMGLLP